jgi:hypothetical protein
MAKKSVTRKSAVHGTGKVAATPPEVEIVTPEPIAKAAPIEKVKTPIVEIQELLDESPMPELEPPAEGEEAKPPQEVRFDILPALTFHIEHRGTHRAFDTDKQRLINTCLDRPDVFAVYAPNGALVHR